MEEREVVVDGFCFKDSKTAAQAKREAAGVRYIRENTDMENPDMVLQLYRKLMDEKLFETPVGIGFLKELRDYLSAVPSMREVDLETIPVEIRTEEPEERKPKREKVPTPDSSKAEQKLLQAKKRLGFSLLANLFLVLVVAGMLVVATTGNHPNILSYENKIIDKYAQWQQELEEREQLVKEKEQELNITP